MRNHAEDRRKDRRSHVHVTFFLRLIRVHFYIAIISVNEHLNTVHNITQILYF